MGATEQFATAAAATAMKSGQTIIQTFTALATASAASAQAHAASVMGCAQQATAWIVAKIGALAVHA